MKLKLVNRSSALVMIEYRGQRCAVKVPHGNSTRKKGGYAAVLPSVRHEVQLARANGIGGLAVKRKFQAKNSSRVGELLNTPPIVADVSPRHSKG